MALHPNKDDRWLAATLLKQIRSKAELVPLIAEEFQHLRRTQTQRLEAHALRSMTTQRLRKPTPQAIQADLDAVRDLMDRRYALGDGRRPRFGAMTANEHQVCIDMAMTQINAQQQRIALHRRAIAIIDAAGVGCLDEVNTAADEAA
jgi:hypothetical protein